MYIYADSVSVHFVFVDFFPVTFFFFLWHLYVAVMFDSSW